MSATQIGAFTPEVITSLNISAVVGITTVNNGAMTTGCGGFTAEQFPGMISTTWRSWTDACSLAFTPASLGGWTLRQMLTYPRRQFWMWSFAQVQGLSPLGAGGISPAAAKGMPPALCAAFHASQIAYFTDFFTQHVCAQWTSACLDQIPATEFSGFQQECAQQLRPDALANLTAAQVSFLPPTTFAVLRNPQIAALPAASCAGITLRQTALLDFAYPSTQCRAINASCAMNLKSDVIGSLTSQCSSHLSLAGVGPAFISSLSLTSVSAWRSGQCAALTAAGIAALPQYAFEVVSPECASGLAATQCQALSAANLTALSTDAVGALTSACVGALKASEVSQISVSFFASLSATAASALQSSQCVSLTAADLAALDAASALALSSECLSVIQPAECRAFNASFLNEFDGNATIAAQLSALTSACVDQLACDTVRGLDATVWSALNCTSSVRSTFEHECRPSSSESHVVRTVLIAVSVSLCVGAVLLYALAVLRRRRARASVEKINASTYTALDVEI